MKPPHCACRHKWRSPMFPEGPRLVTDQWPSLLSVKHLDVLPPSHEHGGEAATRKPVDINVGLRG